MRIIIISIFLLNLLTISFVGLVFQEQYSTARIEEERQKQVQLDQQKFEQEKLVDFKRFPNLRIDGYTKRQTRLLMTAYQIGMPYGGETREIVQGLLLQESDAGATDQMIGGMHLPVGERYYGVMQMKVMAVYDVLNTHPKYSKTFFKKAYEEVTPEEIISKLLTDDIFSIQMAYDYYTKYRKRCKDVFLAITMYNQGPGGALRVVNPAEFTYTVNVIKHVKYNVRPFNQKLEKRVTDNT